jgi:hypothetical protein
VKVKELIEKLSACDGELDILLNDEMLDNLLELKSVCLVDTYDNNFVMLNVDYKYDKTLSEERLV